jgi:uncharacterized protein (TIGR03435 family)
MRIRWLALAFLALAAPLASLAQTGQKPAFEVASVRAATPGTRSSQRVTETRLDFINTPLRLVLLTAFRIEPYLLSAPAWLNNTNFDVQGTFSAGARGRVPEMLQTLLAERFGLVTHIESRPVEAYELVVAKSGITMKEVEPVNELEKDFGGDPATKASDRVFDTLDGPVRSMMIPLGGRRVTARSRYDAWTTAQRTFIVDAARITMAELAGILTMNVDRPVVDKTGLMGVYQFRIELDSNQSALRMLRSAGITTTVKGEPIEFPTGVSTFKAVESLGLTLDDRRAPFDVVVVDKIERNPVEN